MFENEVTNTDIGNPDVSNDDFTTFKVLPKKRSAKRNMPSFSLVLTQDCGKRAVLSRALHEALGCTTHAKFALKDGRLAIGADLPNVDESYDLHDSKNTKVTYRGGLVESIAEHFSLDFGGHSSLAFSDIDFAEVEINGETVKIAYIKMEVRNESV